MLFQYSEVLFYQLHQIMMSIYVNETKNVNKDLPTLYIVIRLFHLQLQCISSGVQAKRACCQTFAHAWHFSLLVKLIEREFTVHQKVLAFSSHLPTSWEVSCLPSLFCVCMVINNIFLIRVTTLVFLLINQFYTIIIYYFLIGYQ